MTFRLSTLSPPELAAILGMGEWPGRLSGPLRRAAAALFRREFYDPDEVALEAAPGASGENLPKGVNMRPVTIIDDVEHYQCGDCVRRGDLAYKPRVEFRRLANPRSKCGLMSICRRCDNIRHTARKRKARAGAQVEVAAV